MKNKIKQFIDWVDDKLSWKTLGLLGIFSLMGPIGAICHSIKWNFIGLFFDEISINWSETFKLAGFYFLFFWGFIIVTAAIGFTCWEYEKRKEAKSPVDEKEKLVERARNAKKKNSKKKK